jgi:hypothetical protein
VNHGLLSGLGRGLGDTVSTNELPGRRFRRMAGSPIRRGGGGGGPAIGPKVPGAPGRRRQVAVGGAVGVEAAGPPRATEPEVGPTSLVDAGTRGPHPGTPRVRRGQPGGALTLVLRGWHRDTEARQRPRRRRLGRGRQGTGRHRHTSAQEDHRDGQCQHLGGELEEREMSLGLCPDNESGLHGCRECRHGGCSRCEFSRSGRAPGPVDQSGDPVEPRRSIIDLYPAADQHLRRDGVEVERGHVF